MGDTDAIGQAQPGETECLEICLIEQIDAISSSAGENATYFVQCSAKTANPDDTPLKMFVYMVSPDRMGKSGAIHPEYNLDTLLETTLKAKLPAREQLRLMNAVLEHIAQIDPRIKGEEGAPQASISRVGGRVYDLQFMQQMYSYVQKELAERQK